MNTPHVNCPRCGGVFQVAQATAGQRVACPWCHDMVTVLVPGQLPPAVPQNQDTPAGEELAAVPPVDSLLPPMAAAGSAETAPPDERAYPANASGEDAVRQATSVDGRGMSQRVLHRMSRHEKDNRRRRKSLIMMAIGALVLIVAAAILLQL